MRRKRKHLTHHGSLHMTMLLLRHLASAARTFFSSSFRGKHDAHVNGNNYSYVPIKKTFLSLVVAAFFLLSTLHAREHRMRPEQGGNFIIHTKRRIWEGRGIEWNTFTDLKAHGRENSFQLHKILRVSREFCWQWTWNVISTAPRRLNGDEGEEDEDGNDSNFVMKYQFSEKLLC